MIHCNHPSRGVRETDIVSAMSVFRFPAQLQMGSLLHSPLDAPPVGSRCGLLQDPPALQLKHYTSRERLSTVDITKYFRYPRDMTQHQRARSTSVFAMSMMFAAGFITGSFAVVIAYFM